MNFKEYKKLVNIEKESGQSTIEFILTFTISLIVLFLFVKVAYIMVDGYITHYATFTASRVYLVHDTGRADPGSIDGQAFTKAKELFGKYVKDTSKLEANSPGSGAKSIYTGIFYEYQVSFTTSKLVGGKTNIKLKSESFLGREPTSGETYERTCAAIMATGARCGKQTTIFDNGG